jgi:hypothetical protein
VEITLSYGGIYCTYVNIFSVEISFFHHYRFFLLRYYEWWYCVCGEEVCMFARIHKHTCTYLRKYMHTRILLDIVFSDFMRFLYDENRREQLNLTSKQFGCFNVRFSCSLLFSSYRKRIKSEKTMSSKMRVCMYLRKYVHVCLCMRANMHTSSPHTQYHHS